jgi:hypothetical protein
MVYKIWYELCWLFKINWKLVDSNYKRFQCGCGRRGTVIYTFQNKNTQEIRFDEEKF